MKKRAIFLLLIVAITALSSSASAFLCVVPILPTVTYNPDALDFGSTPKDATKTLSVVVTYHSQRQFLGGVCVCRCSQPASTTVNLASSIPLNFSASPASFTLTEEASQTVQITFNPRGVAGTYSGTITAGFSAGSQTFPLSVAGVAFAGESNIQVSKTDIDFGPTEVGTTKTVFLTISNQGTATLSGTLSAAAPFSSPSTNFSMAPGGSANAAVRFTPSGSGPAAGQLRINSNDPDAGTLGIGLTGTGALPALNVSTSSLDFGTIPLGESLSKTVTIYNASCTSCPDALTLDLSAFQCNNSEFTVTSPADSSLAPGESTSVQVTFTPLNSSDKSASLSFHTTDPLYPTKSISLAGGAIATSIDPSTMNVSFGAVHLGTTGIQTLTVHNKGSSSLTVSGIASSSSRVSATPTSFSLPAGASQSVQVRYTPTAVTALNLTTEVLNGVLTVSSNDSHLPQLMVDMAGHAVSPLISAMPLDFGTVYMNTPLTGVLNVKNDGNEALSVVNVSSNNAALTPLETSFIVPAGGAHALQVHYNPSVEGTQSATLTAASNDYFTPSLGMTAGGTAVPELNLSVDHLEVTQGIQDAEDSLDLVAGKTTVVRAFIGSTIHGIKNTSNTIRNIDGLLHVKRNGTEVAGSPFASYNGPFSVVPNPDRVKTNDTLNFLVPGDRLGVTGDSAHFDFAVEINPASGGRSPQARESSFADNTAAQDMRLVATYSPRIDYIPISVYSTVSRTGNSVTQLYSLPPNALMSQGSGLLRKIYPVASVDYRIRPPVFFNRDITGDNYLQLTALLFRASHLGNGAPPDRTFGWWPVNYGPPPPAKFIGISEDIPGRVSMGGDLENIDDAQVVFAHEIGHTYGLCHTDVVDSCYPGHTDHHTVDETSISEVGFDTTLMKTVPSGTDFMKSHIGLTPNFWIHPQRYNYLMTQLASLASDPANARGCHNYLDCQSLTQASLLVTGSISSDGTSAQLDSVYATESIPDTAPASPTSSDFRLQGLSSDGEVLYDAPVAQGGDSAFEGDGAKDTSFSFILPVLEGLATVRVLKADQILAEQTVTGGDPSLAIASPAGDETFTDTLSVVWTCTGCEDKEMSYSVLYSPDGGGTFQAIGVDLSDPNFLYDVSKLPGGDAAIVRVVGTDGVRTVSADSPSFHIARKPPVTTIVSPRDGQTFWNGSQIPLAADGADLEDGPLPSSSLRWTSDANGNLGSGGELSTTLPVGTHVLTVTGTDVDGNSSSSSVTIQVVDGASAPRADAGANQTVNERDTVTLDATASSDPDENDSISYSWTQVSGPSATLDNASSTQPTFQAPDIPSDTQLRFLLTVTDGAGHVGTDFVDVLVKNVFYPSLKISDELVDFGVSAIGASSSHTVTVENEGNETLDVENVATSRSAFTATPNHFSLTPGGSQTMTIQFKPSEEARFDSNLRFVTNTVAGVRTMVFLKGQTKTPAQSFRDNGFGGSLLPEVPPVPNNAVSPDVGSPDSSSGAGGCGLVEK